MISELKTVPGHIVHTEPVVWQPTVIVQSHLLSCTDVVLRKDRSFRGVCGQDGMHRPKSAPSVRVTPMRNVGGCDGDRHSTGSHIGSDTDGWPAIRDCAAGDTTDAGNGTDRNDGDATTAIAPAIWFRSRRGGMAQELERSAGHGWAVHASCLRLQERLP